MIILTGGAGFIGSCMLKKLNDEGRDDILVVDHLGEGNKWKNLVGKRFVDFIHKSVFREELLMEIYDEIEAIIHFGACSTTTETDADYLIDNNYSYSKDLAAFAIENNIKFIYASSAATYGDGSDGYSDKSIENLYPLNCYGFSKQAFDQWVVDMGFDQSFIGIKFFNVFGPNEYHKGSMASMIYKSYNQIKENGKVKLFRSTVPEYMDGGQMRDFIYVKDVVNIIWDMYHKDDLSGIFNLGTGKARTWNELVSGVFAAMNLPVNIEYIDMPDELKYQYQNFTEADMNKLQTSLKDLKFSSLEDSINDYVCNHLMQKRIYY